MAHVRSRIVYVQYTNPAAYPPLEHSSRILAQAGWEVLFLGTGAAGAGSLRFGGCDGVVVRRLRFCSSGWFQKLHYAWFCLWVLVRTLIWRPRWIYASDLLSCPVGLLLSYIPGIAVLYHEHDSPSTVPRGLFGHFFMSARRKLVRRTTLCVLPNEARVRQFIRETNVVQEVGCVWNCPTKDEVSSIRAPYQIGDLWIFYHGSIVPSRFPSTVLHALCSLPDCVKIRIIGYETVGHRGYCRQLKDLANELQLSERVELLHPVPTRKQLLDLCRTSDVGIALLSAHSEDLNERNMVGASNKAFDYLACGLAVLVPDFPDWRETYVESGYALACDPADPESIASALDWFLTHPEEMRAMGERGRQRILAEWSYENQFAPVLERMKQSPMVDIQKRL